MAWDLRGDYKDELARAPLSRPARALKQINLLSPPYPVDRNQPILSAQDWQPAASASDQAATVDPAALKAMRSFDGAAAIDSALASVDAVPVSLGRGEGIGSNSWVVSGSRTT